MLPKNFKIEKVNKDFKGTKNLDRVIRDTVFPRYLDAGLDPNEYYMYIDPNIGGYRKIKGDPEHFAYYTDFYIIKAKGYEEIIEGTIDAYIEYNDDYNTTDTDFYPGDKVIEGYVISIEVKANEVMPLVELNETRRYPTDVKKEEIVKNIAMEFGLSQTIAKIYIDFMDALGINMLELLEEWAERFKKSNEWEYTTDEDYKILEKIYNKYLVGRGR